MMMMMRVVVTGDSQQRVPEQFLSDVIATVAVLKRQVEVIVVAQFLVTLVRRQIARTLQRSTRTVHVDVCIASTRQSHDSNAGTYLQQLSK